MGRGRKKAVVHPGHAMRSMPSRSSSRYCHIAIWDENLKCKINELVRVHVGHNIMHVRLTLKPILGRMTIHTDG